METDFCVCELSEISCNVNMFTTSSTRVLLSPPFFFPFSKSTLRIIANLGQGKTYVKGRTWTVFTTKQMYWVNPLLYGNLISEYAPVCIHKQLREVGVVVLQTTLSSSFWIQVVWWSSWAYTDPQGTCIPHH